MLTALPADAFIAAAAVADWRVEHVESEKIKKGEGGPPTLRLVENPDILAGVVEEYQATAGTVVIGFAAETDHVIDNAKAKLRRKGCDLIIANSVAKGTTTFGGETNEVQLISAGGVERWPSMSKTAVADRIVARLAAELAKRP